MGSGKSFDILMPSSRHDRQVIALRPEWAEVRVVSQPPLRSAIRQQAGVSPHAVEGVVEFESARHFLHGPAKQIHVAPCIVAAQCGVTEAKARF